MLPNKAIPALGRSDFLSTKLVGPVDRGTDFADCIALAPTLAELQQAWPFVAQYEGNPESREGYWLPAARRQLKRLGQELGYDAIF